MPSTLHVTATGTMIEALAAASSRTSGKAIFPAGCPAPNRPRPCAGPPPFLTYKVTEPRFLEATYHIWNAFNVPGRTYPRWDGKTVPGNFDAPQRQALNRTTLDWLNERNRERAKAECRKIDPIYSIKGRDCDEFPFASTWQGAAVQPDPDRKRISACPIDAEQNRAAGRELQTWYGVDRILDSFDPFYIRIDGTPPPDKQTGCFTYP